MDQRERESNESKSKVVHQTFGDTHFATIIGTDFVDLKNVTEIRIENDGSVHKVDRIIPQKCSFEWALSIETKHWGINQIAIAPIRVIVDAIVEFTHDGEQMGLDVRFEHLNETSKFEIDTTNFNPLIHGIVPTGIEIKHETDEIPQIKIKF